MTVNRYINKRTEIHFDYDANLHDNIIDLYININIIFIFMDLISHIRIDLFQNLFYYTS